MAPTDSAPANGRQSRSDLVLRSRGQGGHRIAKFLALQILQAFEDLGGAAWSEYLRTWKSSPFLSEFRLIGIEILTHRLLVGLLPRGKFLLVSRKGRTQKSW